MIKTINWKKLLLSFLLTLGSGMFVGFITRNYTSIYNALIKPPLAPPSMLFGIAWIILYAAMSVACYIIFSVSDNRIKVLYIVQLALNLLWSPIFFVFKNYNLASIWILVLDIVVLLLMIRLFKRCYVAGIILIPYFAWILFATYLSFGIAVLN